MSAGRQDVTIRMEQRKQIPPKSFGVDNRWSFWLGTFRFRANLHRPVWKDKKKQTDKRHLVDLSNLLGLGPAWIHYWMAGTGYRADKPRVLGAPGTLWPGKLVNHFFQVGKQP